MLISADCKLNKMHKKHKKQRNQMQYSANHFAHLLPHFLFIYEFTVNYKTLLNSNYWLWNVASRMCFCSNDLLPLISSPMLATWPANCVCNQHSCRSHIQYTLEKSREGAARSWGWGAIRISACALHGVSRILTTMLQTSIHCLSALLQVLCHFSCPPAAQPERSSALLIGCYACACSSIGFIERTHAHTHTHTSAHIRVHNMACGTLTKLTNVVIFIWEYLIPQILMFLVAPSCALSHHPRLKLTGACCLLTVMYWTCARLIYATCCL